MDVRTISYHLGEIFDSGELKENATIRKIGIVQTEGEREVNRPQMMQVVAGTEASGYTQAPVPVTKDFFFIVLLFYGEGEGS